MAVTENNVAITLILPRQTMDELDELVQARHSTREREVQWLIEERARRKQKLQEHFSRLSDMYRARLAREGRLDQTEDEIMEDLRRIREEVANERPSD